MFKTHGDDRKASSSLHLLFILLKRGVTLPDALRILGEVTEFSLTADSGHSLAEVLKAYPGYFPPCVADRPAGAEKLNALIGKIRDYRRLSRPVPLIFPLAYLLNTVFTALILLLLVAPVLNQVYAPLGADLPQPTYLVMQISAFLRSHMETLFFGVATLVFLFALPSSKRLIYCGLAYPVFYLPGLRRMQQQAENIKIFSAWAFANIRQDEPLSAIQIALQATANPVYTGILAKMAHQIENGQDLAAVLQKHPRYFPPQFSGVLEAVQSDDTGIYSELAEYCREQAKMTVAAFNCILNRLAWGFFWLVTAYISLALFLPLHTCSGFIQ